MLFTIIILYTMLYLILCYTMLCYTLYYAMLYSILCDTMPRYSTLSCYVMWYTMYYLSLLLMSSSKSLCYHCHYNYPHHFLYSIQSSLSITIAIHLSMHQLKPEMLWRSPWAVSQEETTWWLVITARCNYWCPRTVAPYSLGRTHR